jgi:hypothetical protein
MARVSLSFVGVYSAVIFLLNFSAAVAQENQFSLDKDHMLGVAEANFNRFASWETGDVLIRVRISGSGPLTAGDSAYASGPDAATALNERILTQRFIFDFRGERFLGMTSQDEETRLFDYLDNEVKNKLFPSRSHREKAFLTDETKQIRIASDDGRAFYKLSGNPSREAVFARFGILQIKGLGIASWMRTWQESELERIYSRLFNSDVLESVTHVGADRYRTFSRIPDANSNVGGSRIVVDWDVVNCVPVAHYGYPGFKDDARPPLYSLRIEWQEINSQMVPLKLREHNRRFFMTRSGLEFVLDEEREVDFHWFSINDDLPDELFDEARLQEPGRTAELLAEHQFNKSKVEAAEK